MSFTDALARYQARVSPNAPQLGLVGNTTLLQAAQALLQEAEDVRAYAQNIAQTIYISQTSGAALAARLADYGRSVQSGVAATGTVTLTAQSAVPVATTIPAGTLMTTSGDGITTPAPVFQTTQALTVAPGGTTAVGVPIQCVVAGTAGNVAANTITVLQTPIGSFGVTNPAALTNGVDPDSDGQARAKAQAAMQPVGACQAIEGAILATSGVYDALVLDSTMVGGPAANNLTYYWCDAAGNQPSGLAAQVQAAVQVNQPPSLLPASATFTVVNLTTIQVSYSAPASAATSMLTPLIQAAIGAYIQGAAYGTTPSPRAGLAHNQVPTVYGMIQAALAATGGIVTNLSLSGTTPTIGAAATTTLYRISGAYTSAISCTRV